MQLLLTLWMLIFPSFAANPNVPHGHNGVGTKFTNPAKATLSTSETNTLATHRGRVAEVRDLIMNTNLVTNINADSTETVTAIAAQNFAFAQRVEDGYFIGEITFDVYCYGSE